MKKWLFGLFFLSAPCFGSGINITGGTGGGSVIVSGGGEVGTVIGVTAVLSNGGNVLLPSTVTVTIPFSCTITNWTIVDPIEFGSINVDVLKASFSTFPTLTDIVGTGNAPSLSSSQKNTAVVSGWTTTLINPGETIAFSSSGILSTTNVSVTLWLIRN